MDLTPFWISIKLSAIVTVLLFFIAFPLAFWLANTRHPFKPVIEAVSALPIVLPPTVLGFYLLVALSHNSPLGAFFEETVGISLVFSFPGLVVASCFYSFPFMLQPLQAGLEGIDRKLVEASYTLGKSTWKTILNVQLPLMRPALLTATVITFAHTMGEFGVVLMVGGAIPGTTKVASVAIYDYVENLDYATAHIYSGILVLLSFLVLLTVYLVNRKHTWRMA